ncbi:hypothetical protein [Pseudoflavitalea rhizosphaerae]|uniref:hypothetical protein n=1 Tax=Pseudoflavitalea rhizosphaerae TaxID=1884793 RepID=UPI000F8E4DAC|nr:hypothetical protein [Pseudoflavitalea rhizosphaerae]
MWQRFRRKKKAQFGNSSSKNTIATIEERLKNKFVSVMQKAEKRLTARQRTIFFCLYFLIMVAICSSTFLKSSIFKTGNKTPAHNSIVILPDITLPDSLNIDYLKNAMQTFPLQDSNSTYLTDHQMHNSYGNKKN